MPHVLRDNFRQRGRSLGPVPGSQHPVGDGGGGGGPAGGRQLLHGASSDTWLMKLVVPHILRDALVNHLVPVNLSLLILRWCTWLFMPPVLRDTMVNHLVSAEALF